jgi:hypothetical protein
VELLPYRVQKRKKEYVELGGSPRVGISGSLPLMILRNMFINFKKVVVPPS